MTKMTSDLEKLSDQRNAILLAEVGVWLHMLGKYSKDFIIAPDHERKKVYKEYYKKLKQEDDPFKLLLHTNWPQNIWKFVKPNQLKNAPEFITQFSTKHTLENKVGFPLLQILVDAHGRGSGTDKGFLKKEVYQKQDADVYLSTAFGFEEGPIDLDDLERKRDELYLFLKDKLHDLKKKLTDPNISYTARQWHDWRKPFIERLQHDFAATVGDTRRPINDVSLWDQTASTAAFFKASLAEILLTGSWRDPLAKDQKDKFKWRILRVGLDSLSFLQNSHRIGDLLERQKLIQDVMDKIKYLIEVEYPVGQEIYRDESFALYLLPDIKGILECTNNADTSLETLIRDAANNALYGEAVLDISLSEQSGRNVFIVGQTLGTSLPVLSPDPETLAEWWKNEKADRCTVCQLRPQGYGADQIDDYKQNAGYYRKKAEERNLCCICMDRIRGRSEDWCKKLSDTSIWIDEVADKNAMVALISARFDLEHWIDGTFVSTLLGLSYDRIGQSDTTTGGGWNGLFSEMKIANLLEDEPHDSDRFPNLNSFAETKLKKGEPKWDKFSELMSFMVDEEDLNEIKKHVDDRQLLTLSIIRKTPSFARLRRTWETTQNFWKHTVKDKLGDDDLVGKVGPRIVINAEKINEPLGEYHAYAFQLGRNIETGFVYDKDNQRLIHIGNVRYLAKRLGIKDTDRLSYEEAAQEIKQFIIKTGVLELYEERSSSSKPFNVATLNVEENDVTIEQHNYTPAIPILTEPAVCMALLPADKALIVAQHIRREYEKQFSKVRNRLPLHLNVVFFKRRTPLYAAMDASKRMLNRKSDVASSWEVVSDAKRVADGPPDNHAVELHLKREPDKAVGAPMSKELKTIINCNLGDNSEDIYHPQYFIISNASGNNDFSDRKTHFQAPIPEKNEMIDLIHVTELKKNDKICFMPSTFDFEFLDVTTRRLELQYDERGARMQKSSGWNSPRPFLLEDLSKFEDIWTLIDKHLTATELKQMIGRIESQREYWAVESIDDDVFQKFAIDVVHNTFEDWKDIDTERELIEEWAANGRLADVIELYTEILKQKPKEKLKSMEVM
jgi:CRISPR-associated Csx11 family protein